MCVCVSFNVPLSVGLLLGVCVYYAVLFSVPLSVGLRVHVCVSFNVPLSVGLLLTSSEGVCMLYCLINILLSVGLTDIKVCICYISHSMSVLL